MATTVILRTCPEPAKVLCFAPHPDDEILGCGGTLHLHAQAGSEIRVVLVTDGTAGDPEQKFDPVTFGEMRRAESRSAAAVIGVPEPVCWGLPDSCEVAESDKLRLVGMVGEEIAGFAPDLVFLPWRGDHQRDHLVLNEVVERGIVAAGFDGDAFGFEVWAPIPRPDLVVDITDILDVKRRALDCFASQFAYGDLGHQVFGMNAYRSLLLERDRGYGEAFQRIVVGS